MEYKNIFITGATGVVGKPLLQKLIKNNHNIYALARSEETMKDLTDLGVSPIRPLGLMRGAEVVLGLHFEQSRGRALEFEAQLRACGTTFKFGICSACDVKMEIVRSFVQILCRRLITP